MADTAFCDTLRLLKQNLHLLDDNRLGELGLCRIETAKEPPAIEIYPEIRAAAQWWADQLKASPIMDNGDAFQSVFSSYVANQLNFPLSDQQIDLFRRWLEVALMANAKGTGWNPKAPIFGSANRGVYNDYHPSWLLVLAWQRACLPGDPDHRFPIKTSMHYDPGQVTVRAGYSAREQVLFPN